MTSPKLTGLALLLVLSTVLLWGCAAEPPKTAPAPAATPAAPTGALPAEKTVTPAQAVAKPADGGDYTHQSLATGSPGMNAYVDSQPGQSNKLERSFAGAPPRIPHTVGGLAIAKTSNPCLSCHSTGIEASPGHVATKIPESHYTDLQTGEKRAEILGSRYNCLSCHVTQSTAQPILQGGN